MKNSNLVRSPKQNIVPWLLKLTKNGSFLVHIHPLVRPKIVNFDQKRSIFVLLKSKLFERLMTRPYNNWSKIFSFDKCLGMTLIKFVRIKSIIPYNTYAIQL